MYQIRFIDEMFHSTTKPCQGRKLVKKIQHSRKDKLIFRLQVLYHQKDDSVTVRVRDIAMKNSRKDDITFEFRMGTFMILMCQLIACFWAQTIPSLSLLPDRNQNRKSLKVNNN